MRKVSSGIRRGAAALAITVLLSIPTAAFADDGHVRPPLPEGPSFWHVVLVLVTHARVLPLVG